MTTERLIKLHVPVPPMLEEALGYTGNGKFVAFYWGAGDEAYYDDGRSSATGEWEAYLAFVQHPTIEPALRPYHLGDSDSEATHELVLDREERKLYVGTARAVNRFLQEQWPPLPTGEITQKEAMQSLLDSLNAENWEEVQTTINPDEIMRKMQEHQQMVQEMTTWLDGRARLNWEREVIMLQAIQNLHMLSVLHPSLYFGTLMLLAVIVCPGWYKLGRLQAAAVASPAPAMAPARRRVVFYKKSQAFVLSIANLAILGSLESSGDTIAATVALRVT